MPRLFGGPISIALRLGLLFAAIAVAVFFGVGAYLYQTLAVQMGQRDNIDLLNKAALVRELLRTMPADERMPSQVQDVLGRSIGQDGMMLEVVGTDGHRLATTMPHGQRLPASALPAPVPDDRAPGHDDIRTLREPTLPPARMLSIVAMHGADKWRVTLLRVRSDRLAILRRYAFDLLGALVAGALVATGLGFLAVRRGLRPLRSVTAKANDISAQCLNSRLAVQDVPPELRELSVSFNAMLDRLEDGVQRLSGFSADLAHDLRTPVNALMMQTQVALSRERPAEEYQALLASNLEEYERLARMIENTLFLARADNAQLALHCEKIDVAEGLARIGDYFEMLADDKGVTLTIEAPPGLTVSADLVLLRRAVNNLVSNAIAHTPPGGHVRLRAYEEDEWVTLSVCNTGAGIPEEHRDHLFERYYRADPARAPGTSSGLGLAIVRAIMQLHGGSARVDSGVGEPAVFTLRFPR